jgi:two-component system, LuxR family, response regulator FixJ
MESSSNRQVLIVDDEDADRQELRAIIEGAGYKTLEFASGEQFLAALQTAPKGCVLLDVRMPDPDGLSIVKKLAGRASEFPIVMVSGHGTIPTAVRALQEGALDFVEKPVDAQQLLASVERAFEISERTGPAAPRGFDHEQLDNTVTRREMEVLRLLVRGRSNKAVAFDLGISEKTVEVHRNRIMKRLHVKSFAELIRLAVEAGI